MTGGERSDEVLLRAHADGDPDAFAEILRRHRDRLWAVALRTIGDREEAADALQDALLSAHRAAARFRGDSAVTTWLHRIVVNACLDRLRRRQAHPTVPLPDGSRQHDSGGRYVGGVEPAAPTTDHDTALVVRQALDQLPVDQRIALILVDVQGYSVAEAALITRVAEGTVKSRCSRGRARLALLLGHLRPQRDRPPAHRPGGTDAGGGAVRADPSGGGAHTGGSGGGGVDGSGGASADTGGAGRADPAGRQATGGNPEGGGTVPTAAGSTAGGLGTAAPPGQAGSAAMPGGGSALPAPALPAHTLPASGAEREEQR